MYINVADDCIILNGVFMVTRLDEKCTKCGGALRLSRASPWFFNVVRKEWIRLVVANCGKISCTKLRFIRQVDTKKPEPDIDDKSLLGRFKFWGKE